MSDRKTFIAQAQGKTDFEVEVIESHNGKMIICTDAAAIYITKEQAIKFFNLKESEPSSHAALIAQCEQDKKDFPEFWKDLYQWKDSNENWHTGCKVFAFDYEYRSHPHRASIIEFNQCSDDDKKRWESKCNKPMCGCHNQWVSNTKPKWNDDVEYRLRPRTCQITIGGKVLEYPEPVRVALEQGQGYWYVYPDRVEYHTWYDDSDVCKRALKIGGIHLTEQAAQKHLEVLQAVNAQVAR